MRPPVARLPIVGVMGSAAEEHAALAEAAGRVIARLGCHLLTGGAGGVMRAASRAFVAEPGRRGQCIGILRAGVEPNEFVEIPIRTHLSLSGDRGTDPLSRNHVNVLTADVVVVLPGGAGTRSELELAVRYGRPVVVFIGSEEVDDLNAAKVAARFRDSVELRGDAAGLEAIVAALLRAGT